MKDISFVERQGFNLKEGKNLAKKYVGFAKR